MFETMLAWYVRENLGGRFINLVWQESLLANEVGEMTLIDAIDGVKHINDLIANDYLVTDMTLWADPGIVILQMRPDNSSSNRYDAVAVKSPIRTPLPVPTLVEADLTIAYKNENQANDLYVACTAIKLTSQNLAKFTVMSEILFKSLPDAIIKGYQNTAGILPGSAEYYAGGTDPYTVSCKIKKRG